MNVKISVIIPVYNTENYLAAALDSVLKQSFQEIEVLCVNDGSTDRSGEILQAYSSRDPRVVSVCQENQGPSAARNNGIKRAAGKYIQFLDSDDLLGDPEALRCLYDKAEACGLDQLFFDADSFYETAELEQENAGYSTLYHRHKEYPVCKPGKLLFADMQENWDYKINPFLQFLRRDFLLKNELFFCEDMRNHEDEVFTLQCSILASNAGYLGKSFYKRRVRAGSLVTEMNQMRAVIDLYHGIRRLIDFAGDYVLQEDEKVYSLFFRRVRVLQEIAGSRCLEISTQQKREWIGRLDEGERADCAAGLSAWEYMAQTSKSLKWVVEKNKQLKEDNESLHEKTDRQRERIKELKEKLQKARAGRQKQDIPGSDRLL